jgi:hypothetical protein
VQSVGLAGSEKPNLMLLSLCFGKWAAEPVIRRLPFTIDSFMDTTFWVLLVLSLTMLGVTWPARRIGNEGRDVALLGVVAGLLGAGSVAAAVL